MSVHIDSRYLVNLGCALTLGLLVACSGGAGGSTSGSSDAGGDTSGSSDAGGGTSEGGGADGGSDIPEVGCLDDSASVPSPVLPGSGFNAANGFNSDVYSLATTTEGSCVVYAGGAFSSYRGGAANRIVRILRDGRVDTRFDTGTGFDGAVRRVTLATDGSGDVYVAGEFTRYNGTAVNRSWFA
jgi:beta-propeller uncharacterized protein DUF5122